MCITFHYFNENYPLILLNNRDEAIDRPTLALSEWVSENGIKIFSGKDAIYGGTWLGVNEYGKYCVLLNLYQEDKLDILPWKQGTNSPVSMTRGVFISNYLRGPMKAKEYIESLDNIKAYNEANRGFILVIGDCKSSQHYYYNSIDEKIIDIKPSEVFGISNYPLDSKCHKVEFGKSLFSKELLDLQNLNIDMLLNRILKNNQTGPLPTSEHQNVSSIFVEKFLNTHDNLIHGTR
ncbi:hypothetical protein DLAC_05117 [Tieghemostelium lacteum]|uniref:Uncharacterized protein n=1 Tax=Tieghemostelium lacteum TaxID=361077 RepID=A0A151ZIA4_TIELA|nr:hypothetical protein DLAC_05117 [Tieghemostelium lacteum]|eukprot:KYQ93728.1 hypothetical protein DLAC_05117 [Tieghemostelium lacteum]